MVLVASLKRMLVLAAAGLLLTPFAPEALAATVVVNVAADTSTGGDGVCSLREAIVAINNGADASGCIATGSAYGVGDTINFSIPGTGVHTINLVSTLPPITKPVLIDGYSQPGASANTLTVGGNAQLKIEISGGAIGTLPVLQLMGGGGSTIRGLVINNAAGHVIEIGFSLDSQGNTIAGNYLGVDPTGTTFANGTNTVIVVQGGSNVIGGPAPADRNVIAGHGGVNGGTIYVLGPSSDTVIQGNYIGVNAPGTAAVPTGGAVDAIELIGTVGAVVSGNVIVASNLGIRLDAAAAGAAATVIKGNFLGTDATGTTALGGFVGIQVAGNSTGTTIGGGAAGEGNVVSGGVVGIDLRSGTIQTTLLGNKVGTDVTGSLPLGNSECGISVAPAVTGAGIHIGGAGAGEGNIVAFNGTQGVQIADGSGTLLQHNSIFGNGGLGISFSGRCDLIASPTPNDPGDADIGANGLQNYPAITSAQHVGGNAIVSGTLDSTPATVFTVELFSSAACDASGNGEGQTFLGTASVITNSSGLGNFGPVSFAVPPGQPVITATATGSGNNTSEFSPCLAFPSPPAVQSRSSRKAHGAATFDLPLAP